MDFNGKKILLIMPKFFGYEAEIVRHLKEKGALVKFYSDRPSLSTGFRVLNRINPRLVEFSANRYFRSIIQRHRDEKFDFIFVLKGESLSTSMTKELFAAFPEAKKIFYLWDSFKNAKGAFEKKHLFDLVFTFDPYDAQRTPGVKFRPLFFSSDYLEKGSRPSDEPIDVLFVGTAHSDRYEVLSKLRRSLPADILPFFYLFLASKWIYRVRRLVDPRMRGASYADFAFKSLSVAESASLFKRAKIVVDVERKVQKGLTIRSLEVLATGKKLVTTNAQVELYDFYSPTNIHVLDRNDPRIPESFFASAGSLISSEIVARYSIDSWLDDIFNGKDFLGIRRSVDG